MKKMNTLKNEEYEFVESSDFVGMSTNVKTVNVSGITGNSQIDKIGNYLLSVVKQERERCQISYFLEISNVWFVTGFFLHIDYGYGSFICHKYGDNNTPCVYHIKINDGALYYTEL